MKKAKNQGGYMTIRQRETLHNDEKGLFHQEDRTILNIWAVSERD